MNRSRTCAYRTDCVTPVQELGITAVLLGALVHHGLLVDVSLRIALRFVAEAMAQPQGNKLLRFAQLALGEFRSDVGAWPDFCVQLLKVGFSLRLAGLEYSPYGRLLSARSMQSKHEGQTIHTALTSVNDVS